MSAASPWGSSPRMRGTLAFHSKRCNGYGIIPAYAGNTLERFASDGMRRDHPRVCGEHSDSELYLSTSLGSSPRMRGTQGQQGHRHARRGIIPAYAGNTRTAAGASMEPEDHPRVCGEHPLTVCHSTPFTGSSPRMRGTLISVTISSRYAGIIPAYAGNTVLRRLS